VNVTIAARRLCEAPRVRERAAFFGLIVGLLLALALRQWVL